MKYNIKKGFTLLELLTVIIILAILTAISIPTIQNIISNTQKSSFKDSVSLLLNAAENEYMSGNIQGGVTDKNYEFVNGKMTKDILDFNGTMPLNGNVIVKSNGQTEAVLFNGEWCAVKPIDKKEVYMLKVGTAECVLSNMTELVVTALGEESTKSNIIYIYNPFFDTVTAKGYNDIYTSLDNYQVPINDCGTSDDYYNGNYQKHRCLTSKATSVRLNAQTNNSADRILSGTNTYNLSILPSKNNSWLGVFMMGGCWTSSADYSNIKLNFSDGYIENIKTAIDDGYISPLMIYGSSSSSSYVFPNTYNAILGGSTGSQSYADLFIYMKPLNKTLKSITITSSTSSGIYPTCSDGLHVFEYADFDISPYPNGPSSLTAPNIIVGKTEETVTRGNQFVEDTVTAIDYMDGELGNKVNVSGYVNYNVPGQYLINFNVINSSEIKAETKTKKINVIEKPYYGEGIDELRTNIYTTKDNFANPVGDCGTTDDYYNGNYQRVACLSSGSQVNKLNKETNKTLDRILAGTNTYTFENSILYNKSWIKLELIGSCYTSTNQYSNLKLNFEDGYIGYINQAIDDGYIDPAVIYGSSMYSSSYVFPTPQNLLSGGSTGSQGFANFHVYIKPLNKKLESVTVTSSISSGLHSSCSDGFGAYELLNFEFSVLDRPTLQIQEPYITKTGSSREIITAGSEFVENNLKAFDNQDFVITNRITTTGSFNNNIPGIYDITYNVIDSDGNKALPVFKTIEVIPKGVYESNYSVLLSNVYNTLDGFTNPIASCGSGTNYFNGNYKYALCLTNNANIRKLSRETNGSRDMILAGTNTYTFERMPFGNSNWIRLLMYGNCYTSTNAYSNITLNFSDGYNGFISNAIASGYIEEFVIYGSAASSGSYVFPSTKNTIFGGSTGSQSYAGFYIFIKPKNKVLESVTLTSSISSGLHSSCSDGFDAYELINYDLSISPK